MKNNFSKRIFALFLSVLMVVTALPMTVYAKTTEWTQLASSDFANTDWGSKSTSGSWTQYTSAAQSPVLSSGDKTMSWAAVSYTSNGDISVTENGTYITDGYMYLRGYGGAGENPLINSKNFKIDIAFRFDSSTSFNTSGVTGTDSYCMIKLGTSPALGKSTDKMWESNVLAQDAYGRLHVGSVGYNEPSNASNAVALSNSALSADTDYHYIMKYDNGLITTYVTDANGKTVVTLNCVRASVDTSSIHSISIGDDNLSDALRGMNYRSITIYTSTDESSSQTYVDSDKDKYVMTYFTGNSTEGETLHMAVSDDGLNFEALNGNQPIWDSTKLTGSEASYPDNAGIAASGHVRDPYAFQAQDGSYYVLATDLNTENGQNWGNNSKMMVWHLDSMADLADTNPWFIDTESIVGDICEDGVDRAWAPEAIWDPEAGHYMLFWAVGYKYGATDGDNTHMYYVYTDDFKTFLTEPKQLINTGADNIDGNITYDGSLYYLWFKDEKNKKIGYATSEHASGPYSSFTAFTDTNYESVFEGPEVYQLHSTGNYVLMADHYASMSYFATYQSGTLDGFQNNNVATNLNYLQPRHGSVMNITTAEYNRLVEKYGKTVFDSTGVENNKTANDYLVARYFTNDDASNDSTGHGNTLTTVNNVSMTNDYNGKVAASFNSNSNKSSSASGGSYASLNTADMFKDYNLNAKDGVTFSWYGYATAQNVGRYFDWSSTNPGEIVWDGSPYNQGNTTYVYATADSEFGAVDNSYVQGCTGIKGSTYINDWHLFTLTVCDHYLIYSVDGSVIFSQYAKNGESVTVNASPYYNYCVNDSLFTTLATGNLSFGVSSWGDDAMFDGYISDFRVYAKALSNIDIENSLTDLNTSAPSTEVNGAAKSFYDPMEDTTVDGVTYTKYDSTVTDDIHKEVLDVTYANASHYTYGGASTDSSKGYTISAFYNPGASVSGDTIFNIGRLNSTDGSNRQYFELLEDGHLYYNWEVNGTSSYIDIENAFGDSGLTADSWVHITIQIVPSGSNDIIYVYVDGKLVSKTDTYTASFNKSIVSGRSMHDFFAADHSVYYGASCGHWSNATDGYLDDFTVYNGVYSAKSIFVQDCNAIADSLYALGIAKYEAAMAALKGADYVYTNMYDAYLAYDRMCRYVDSYTYGTDDADPEKMVDLYNALLDAIDNMEPFKTPATVEGYNAESKNAIPAAFTHNMLTQPTGVFTVNEQDVRAGETSTTYDNTNSRISSSNFVWLYTGLEGDTPTAPYSSGFYKQSASTTAQYGASMFITNDVPMAFGGAGIGDDDNFWHQNTSNTEVGGSSANVDWYYATGNYSKTYRMINQDDTYAQDMNNNSWYNASGYARFTGDESNFVADSESDITHTYTDADGNTTIYKYLISFTPTFKSRKYWKSLFSSGYTDCGTFANGTGTVQVINYDPVYKSLIDPDRLDVISNATLYSPASMKEIFDAYDAITGQSYLLSSTNDAESLAKTIKEQVDTLDGVDITKPVEKADYSEAISTADAEIKNLTEKVNSGESDEYTTSSWNAYENACYAIQEHFTSLDPTVADRNEEYATDQTVVDRLQNNISAAKAVLVQKADYSDIDTAMADNGVVETTHSSNNVSEANGQQVYTYSSWLNFDNAYDDASYFSTKDTDYRNDTEKYAVTYETNSYGPYIGYTKDGNIVTDSSVTPYYYVYCGVFYENDGDAEPSQFETGDYIKDENGNFIKLNGCRYYASAVSTTDLSQRQQDITATAEQVTTAHSDLNNVADYQNYDYSQELAALADKTAYNDNGAAIQSNVDTYGTAESPAEYSGTSGTPYITVNGVTYKDADQEEADNATRTVLNTLNSNKRGYDVIFNVYVDGVQYTQEYTNANKNPKYYGDIVTLNAASVEGLESIVPNCDISKCEITTTDNTGDTKTSIINTSSVEINRRIQEDTVVNLYLVTRTSDAVKIKVQDYFGTSIDVGYASVGTTISVNGDTISYTDVQGNEHNITAIESPYYTFDHFDLGNNPADSEITVDSNNYVFTQRGNKSGNMTYTANGGTINGEESISDVKLNTVLELTTSDADFLVWVKSDKSGAGVGDWHIASYDASFSTFSADSGFVYQVVTNSNWSAYLTQAQYDKVIDKLPFSFGTSAELVEENGSMKFRLYCDFSYDSSLNNVTIVEAGAVYSSTANDEASLVKGAADCRTVVANAINDTTNSYTITKKDAGTGNHYMRSYVSFMYSDGSGNTIPRVVYGPVVKCEDGAISK